MTMRFCPMMITWMLAPTLNHKSPSSLAWYEEIDEIALYGVWWSRHRIYHRSKDQHHHHGYSNGWYLLSFGSNTTCPPVEAYHIHKVLVSSRRKGHFSILPSILHLFQMLELAIVSQARQLGLANGRVILARVPQSLDCLHHSDIVGLKLVESNCHNHGCNVQQPVKHFSHRWVLSGRDIIRDTRSEVVISGQPHAEKRTRVTAH